MQQFVVTEAVAIIDNKKAGFQFHILHFWVKD